MASGNTPALRLVVDGEATRGTISGDQSPAAARTAVDQNGPIVPLHPLHVAPTADEVAALERHGLRIAIYADATVTVAAPHMAGAPCEHLVDAHVTRFDPDSSAAGQGHHVIHDHDAADGRFVVRYEPPDDSGPIARFVGHLFERGRSAERSGGHELHLETEHRVHVIDLATWDIDLTAAEEIARLANEVRGTAPGDVRDATIDVAPPDRHATTPACDAVARRLRDLAQLHDDGLITDEQYAAKRAEIIAAL